MFLKSRNDFYLYARVYDCFCWHSGSILFWMMSLVKWSIACPSFRKPCNGIPYLFWFISVVLSSTSLYSITRRCSPHFPRERSFRPWLSGCSKPSPGPGRHAVLTKGCWHWHRCGGSLPNVEPTVERKSAETEQERVVLRKVESRRMFVSKVRDSVVGQLARVWPLNCCGQGCGWLFSSKETIANYGSVKKHTKTYLSKCCNYNKRKWIENIFHSC